MGNLLNWAVQQYRRGGEQEKLIDTLAAVARWEPNIDWVRSLGDEEAARFEDWIEKSYHSVEDNLRDALPRKSDEQISRALVRLERSYRYRICGQLRRCNPTLSPEELADIWQDTVVVISRRAMRRRLDVERPLAGQLSAIACRRARDLYGCSVHAAGNRSCPDLPVGRGQCERRWQMLSGLQQEEVIELIWLAIAGLSRGERGACDDHFRAVADQTSAADRLVSLCEGSTEEGRQAEEQAGEAALQKLRQEVCETLRDESYDLFSLQAATGESATSLRQLSDEESVRAQEFLDRLIDVALQADVQEADAASSDLEDAEQYLTSEDRYALDLLGPDLAQRTRNEYAAARPSSSAMWSHRHTDSTTYLPNETVLEDVPGEGDSKEAVTAAYQRLLRGKRLAWAPQYRLTELLGEGGQGVVYRVRCPGTDGFWTSQALKIFPPDRYSSVSSYIAATRRMARIAAIVAKIHSENVLDVQRFERQDGVRMMLMEWIDGYDLCRLMVNATLDRIYHRVDSSRWNRIKEVVLTAGPDQPRLKPGVAVAIVRSCLSALGQMHMEDIVHGDIKTSNIMLRRNGNVKLVDIGSATAWRESREPYHFTYRYAAPEVLAGRPCTPQSDLASLGYVLVELLSGRALFADLRPGSQLRQAKEEFPKRLPELLPKDVRKSEQLVALCRRLVEPDLTKRYHSAHHANYDTDYGAHTFLDRLVLVNLSTAYDHEIHLLLEALGQPRKGTVVKQGAE